MQLLAEKVEQLEDECCATEEEKLKLETSLEEEQARLKAAKAEVERQTARAHIQPVGIQELEDQLEVAADVRETLCSDIARLTEELVQSKLEHAQDQAGVEDANQKLRRSDARLRATAIKMTRLEVQLADSANSHAEQEEELAKVFREAMLQQEGRIRELEAAAASGAPPEKEKSRGGPKKWFGH